MWHKQTSLISIMDMFALTYCVPMAHGRLSLSSLRIPITLT